MKALIYYCISLLIICMTIAGCPSEDESNATDASAGDQVNPYEDTSVPKVEQGFIEEEAVKPLSESPLTLNDIRLGAAPDSLETRMAGKEAKKSEHWRDEGITGMVFYKIPGELGSEPPSEEHAYYDNGELVGFQQTVEQDKAAFEGQVAETTAFFGDPSTTPPKFVAESRFYEFLQHDALDQLLFWTDPFTQTAIVGGHYESENKAFWLLLQPERYDSAKGDTFASMGS